MPDNANYVPRDVFETHDKLLSERFRRDAEDIKHNADQIDSLEKAVQRVAECQIEITALVKQNDAALKDLQARVKAQEDKPAAIMTKWQAAIISAIAGGIVALIISALKYFITKNP